MLRTVPPFDLVGTCAACGVTTEWLSEQTGIPEEELLSFSRGQHALSPRDWFAILDRMPPPIEPSMSHLPREDLLHAYRTLMRDVEAQDRQEDADEETFL